jgi:hypothetical protein
MMTPAPRRAILGAMRSYTEPEWKRVREAGMIPFLIRHGFLGRGLPLGIVTAVVIEVYLGGTFPDALSDPSFLGRLAFAVAVFTLSGSLAARANWALHERRFPGADRGAS